MNKVSKKRKLSSSAWIVIALVIVAAILFGTTYIYASNQKGTEPKNPNTTQSEKEVLPEVKQDQPTNPENPSKNPGENSGEQGTSQQVNVILVDAVSYEGNVEVRAFVPSLLQDGTCTITFTKGNETVTKQVSAHADATTTVCTNTNISVSEFPSRGMWKVGVSFKSVNHSGNSEIKEITI